MDMLSFQGRASRKTYWFMFVSCFVVSIGMRLALNGNLSHQSPENVSLIGAFLTFIVSLLMVWWSIATQVRRLHDLDKKGWWVLVNLVPLIGSLLMLIYLGFFKGSDGHNRFGSAVV
ncbi:DUF805 domain-containing protein [Vibrio ezurae]|uniref:DUF805 domain-containing protein n=1 Tax=Vibrio ezurae NBRC 102218 TaxID=1219080 RepID=U3CFE6_9VIBR|nr:DUF805 domain-containing protein [Vibrio ezurae]GAD79959.1 hypothetical protein VEZ01S_21_00820 [Vibrio ezurae NBRC 102218]